MAMDLPPAPTSSLLRENYSSAPSVRATNLETTTEFGGLNNHGTQIGQNTGTINNHYHASDGPSRLATEVPSTTGQDDLCLPLGLPGVVEVEKFVGREKELLQIDEAFAGGSARHKIVVLYGLGGVGKTQLAVTYVKGHFEKYLAVFWLNGADEDSLDQSFVVAAQRLRDEHPASTDVQVILQSGNAAEIAQAMVRWLGRGQNKHWLLVFDNVDNPKLPENPDGAYHLAKYLPPACHGHVIVTTRLSGLKIGYNIPLKQLDNVDESLAIIVATSRRRDAKHDRAAKALAKRLGGLPLALSTAGAFLRQTSMSFESYLQHYESSWKRLHQIAPIVQSYQDRTLRTTWELSLSKISEKQPAATALLELWGCFDHQDLWYELLAEGWRMAPEPHSVAIMDDLEFHRLMRLLHGHCLVEPIPKSDGYRCHPCVHDWIRAVFQGTPTRDKVSFALISIGFSVPQDFDEGAEKLQRRLLSHAVHLIPLLANIEGSQNELILDACLSLGNLFRDQGKTKEAEAMYKLALSGLENLLGSSHTLTLVTFNNLGLLYSQQERLREAEAMYQRALVGKERVFGRQHRSTLETVKNLGTLYIQQDRPGEAEAMLQRAMAGFERVLGPEHMSTLAAVNELGRLYSKQGRMEEAEVMLRRALAGKESVFGRQHRSTLEAVNNLGTLYHQLSKIEEAEAMYWQALTGFEKVLGPDHTSTLEAVSNLGILYSEQDEIEQAEAMHLRALAGKEKVLGQKHKSTLETVNNLGLLYAKQGNTEKAIQMFDRALEGYRTAHGRNYQVIQEIRANLEDLNRAERLRQAMAA